AIFTKYHPFYLLSFILAHLSIFMFMTPSSYFPEWNPVAFFWMYIGIMLLNAILFLFCYRKILTSKTIYYVSYLMFFSIFFIVTITEDLPLFYLNNLIYIAILIWMIYYWTKIDKQHALLVITSIYAAIYLLYKVFYWVFTHYGTWMLIFLLAFSMLLVFISVVIVGLLNKGKSNR